MNATSGDRTALSPSPGGLTRRRLLVTAAGTAVGGAAALVARQPGARAAGSLLVGSKAVGDEAVSTGPGFAGDWFEQVVAATADLNPPFSAPGVADRVWAISWVSALAALDARTDRRPSAGPRFEAAAVATAVHDALVAQVPDQTTTFDAALAASLAPVRDGDAKQAGIGAGQDAAARTLSEREGDGLDAASINVPFTPPPEAPGVYRLPPGATATVGAGLRDARPFLLGRADRFRPGPPPALGSDCYRRDLQEVQRLGGVVSERTELQSDMAWLAPQMQYTPALRELVGGPSRSLSWKVRLLAAFSAATADALIASGDTKFTYLHWRPVTAIRAADTDGDPLTDPDRTWSSYLMTPAHPDYPSAHAVIAGAAEQVLEYFTGPRTPVSFTAVIMRGDGRVVSREYRRGTQWSTLTQDNVHARVWAGVHFRFSDAVGASMGRQVGDHDVQRLGLSPR